MTIEFVLPVAAATCATAVALAVAWRDKRSLVLVTFVAGMLLLASEQILAALSAEEGAEMLAWQRWRMGVMAAVPVVWLAFSLVYSRGNAAEFIRKWRWVLIGIALVPALLLLISREAGASGIRPLTGSTHRALELGWTGRGVYLVDLLVSVLILINLERTYAASVGTIRWRVKFMLFGLGAVFVVRLYTSSQAFLFRFVDLSLVSLNSAALLLASLLIGRHVLRGSRFEVNVYPSRSVLQGSVVVLLAGIYFLVVGLLANAVSRIGGGAAFAYESLLVLTSIVALVVLVQSDRMRLRFGRFISRNFQRPLYDYRTVWRRFAENTGSHVDEGELCRALVKLVVEVFQALSVAIWLVDEKEQRLTMAAASYLPDTTQCSPTLSIEEVGEVLSHFRRQSEPLDLEVSKSRTACLLAQIHPTEFPRRKNRIALPMCAHGQMAGILIIGDRVGGAAFTAQDYDMLACVGDHATASLLNVQLSRRLLAAKEVEAFQTMAAFFVHDLKNAASTLRLTLENLPIHFEDPAFREDALRAMRKSVTHINRLIERLTLLRHDARINPIASDFNRTVADAVAALESDPKLEVLKEFAEIPPVSMDGEQVGKVVTNLVINAKEATGGAGKIEIRTRAEDGWAVLSVADNGCGMPSEFIERSLFRPFQTTKQNGMGIGMFQSKMIVEVHGGKLTVASEVGRGTRFQMFLPIHRTPP